ncbi:LTA synthase family protein [Rubrolithibacter danxiaensis]|uniref:LTA synthase family protein n=1 Tax=Rubrolithibacter danxiaensis TaxID=3390805 RepID=UPI003BF84D5D
MLKSLFILIRYFLFWLLFFFIDRLVFLLYFTEKLKNVRFGEISKTFLYGLRLDTSMAGYISILPLLMYIFLILVPRVHISALVPKIYTRVLIILFSFISIVNFNIYREWGSKVNFRALDFAFNAPNEAIASSASSPVFSSLLIFFFLVVISLFLEKWIVNYRMVREKSLIKRIVFSILIPGITFLLIRGGWQLSPVNESMAYFSQNIFLNHAGINTEWSLFRDVLRNKYGHKNPYQYFKTAEAKAITNTLYEKPAAASIEILQTTRPNVVLIIMESFTASVVESLGGEIGVTPRMEELIKDGLLFTNIYASGDRTDKGLVAVLSAFPSQAVRSVIKENNKQEKLPSIAGSLRKKGYATSFYYGGESEFFNMKSYILSHSYEKIIDKHYFDKKDMNSKWGAYDEVVYKKQLAGLKNEQTPFFSTLLTLTNHEPFELPVNAHFKGNSLPDKFRSTAYYADSCLYAYLTNAKKEKWYDNTLFIVVADHGHRLPGEKYDSYHPLRYKIPLLLFGNAIKPEYRGKRIETIGSQTDIAATLLSQLKIDDPSFNWSRNLLNPKAIDFAFFDWDNGFGVVTDKQTVTFDNVGKNIIYRKNAEKKSNDESILKIGKAYMQTVFEQYLNL